MQFPTHSVHTKKLRSGALLVSVVAPNLPYSVAGVFVRAGSRFDPVGKEGTAHFFEHLLLTRTKAFPKKEDRLQKLESLGISFTALTSKEWVMFRHTQLHEHTLISLTLLAEAFNDSFFTSEDVTHERSVILDEITREEKETERILWKMGAQALWPKSLLGRNSIGTRKSISSITLNDLSHFKDTHYYSTNTVFVIVSAQKAISNQAEQIINAQYKKVTSEKKPYHDVLSSPLRITFTPPPFGTGTQTTRDIGLYFTTIPASAQTLKEQVTISFIRDYLSNTWISKLVGKLRLEKGWTYWVSGDSGSFSDTGFLELTFSTPKETLLPALEVCLAEIQKLKSGELDSAEAFTHHQTAKIADIIKAYDPDMLFSWYGEDAVVGHSLFGPREQVNMIKALSPEDVRTVAQKYLTKVRCSLIILDKKNKKMETQAIKLIERML